MLNDDVVAPGRGFGMHPHRDMEIVTWVLDGALEHRDTEGNVGVITRNVAQRMSAGTGIRHSETNASTTEPVHLLQMWVPPDTAGHPARLRATRRERPAQARRRCSRSRRDAKTTRRFVSISATRRCGSRGLTPGQRVDAAGGPVRARVRRRGHAPSSPALHRSDTGDAARLTDAGAIDVSAADDGAHVVVWEMYATLA